MTCRTGVVVSLGRQWTGAQEMTVDVPDTGHVRALAYPQLVGDVRPGDTVVLNTTALDRGLGTGGYALVVSATTTAPPRRTPGPGHLVKARYTPLQAMVLGVDEQDSPHHDTLRDADDLHAMPVVVADLHSALPAIVAGARHQAQLDGRLLTIAYVMTDGGALPAWFSRTVATLRETGWLDTCITVGQAFGGDHDAVTLHSGLLAAHHVTGADLTIVTQGPGNLGTGTRWGFSGVATGEAVNATTTLRGRPVASLRISGADPRERHRGISHHSTTAYGRVALTPADVVVPHLAPAAHLFDTPHAAADLDTLVTTQARALADAPPHHTLVTVDTTPELADALTRTPAALSTMGRGLHEDPAAFLATAAAGVHAARLAAHRRDHP
ncbi:DUF3866 family protein [Sanguibacter sp. YZGR15]|uniref:DUF3866 family protein n=2 Tax=Sanguibacter suaedae TaxID=2795737 RepID=A0A934IAN8_9MICO|nr:DUF3866 family protein [Sanguibacter suaedae]